MLQIIFTHVGDGTILFVGQSSEYMDFLEVKEVVDSHWPGYGLRDLRMLRDHVLDRYYYLGLCREDRP